MICSTVSCKLRTRERWQYCTGCTAKLEPWARAAIRAAVTKPARTKAVMGIRRTARKLCDRRRARIVL